MHSYKKSFLVYVVLISTVAACPPLVADGPLCLLAGNLVLPGREGQRRGSD